MQVGEQEVARLEHRDLGRLRLLDLDDHVALAEDGRRVGEDLRSLRRVLLIGDRRPETCALLNVDLVPGVDELPDARRRERDPVLVDLDLASELRLS